MSVRWGKYGEIGQSVTKLQLQTINKPRDLKYNMVTMGSKTVLNSTIL